MDFETSDSGAGEYFSRCAVSCGRREADCAVLNERMDSAVSPFVKDEKHDFNVLAEPMRSDICVTLSTLGSEGQSATGSEGPERTRDGTVHSLVSV